SYLRQEGCPSGCSMQSAVAKGCKRALRRRNPFSARFLLSTVTGATSFSIEEIPTPFVLVSIHRVKRNIRKMSKRAAEGGVSLRPHAKTHKSLNIARLQLDMGAVGLCVARAHEAIVFLEGLPGLPSITVTYPFLSPREVARLCEAAAVANCDLRLVVDSAAGLTSIRRGLAVLAASGRPPLLQPPGVYLKVDVGLGRCGVPVSHPERAVRLAADVLSEPTRLRFCGLLSHSGHAYACAGRDQVVAAAVGEAWATDAVRRFIEGTLDVVVPEVSVGSTPTELVRESYYGLDEVRPGNYVFLDCTAVRMGLAVLDDVALTVVSTVVSASDEFYIIDAGSKALSSDLGAHGTAPAAVGAGAGGDGSGGGVAAAIGFGGGGAVALGGFGGGAGRAAPALPDHGVAFAAPRYDEALAAASYRAQRRGRLDWPPAGSFSVARLSEEHGWLRRDPQLPQPRLAVGDRVRVLPSHACPVVNLSDELLVETGGT
ncbi:unnamed protein product, partial [Phaeothamnion confervicola]